VLLAGDAAHRHTPTTGLGLNSAIQDAHNLPGNWPPFSAVRRAMRCSTPTRPSVVPAGERNVNWALFTFSNHQLTGPAIGIVANDPERSRANFAALAGRHTRWGSTPLSLSRGDEAS
jgi:2,4-dichlorophenol 6-monooxygenase